MKKSTVVVEIISSLFILLFVYTALNKLYELERFRNALKLSPLVGPYRNILALGIPILELTISALLFIPRTKLLGLWASSVLMLLFTLYVGYMIKFTPHLPCTCGGIIGKMNWHDHLYFNATFTILGFLGCFIKNYNARNRDRIQAESYYSPS